MLNAAAAKIRDASLPLNAKMLNVVATTIRDASLLLLGKC
jgi:hypothetical protein